MTYGQFQYYNDELNGWIRSIIFHKGELHESVRQIGVLLDLQIITIDNEKASGEFTDQLMVQEQQLEHISNQIISQQQRLERTAGKPIDYSISQLQDSLRSKIRTAERNFLRTKYTCSIFLSSFLGDRSLALQN
jgi:hypothetical protein